LKKSRSRAVLRAARSALRVAAAGDRQIGGNSAAEVLAAC
jgi:hypothetical protein